ncbi:MAG: molybdopterin-binding protein [Xanthobacteraceae bacterium]
MGADSSIQRIVRLTPLHAILACIQSRVAPVAPHRSALDSAHGATLAEDVVSAERPQRAIALRDGFAVNAAAIADAGPYTPVPLTLVARRIDAGDALPSGTDAVAPLDAIALRGDRAEAIAAIVPGEGVLQAGGDAAPATVLRRGGARLRAIDVAAMAAAGIAEVSIRSPRIAVVHGSAARTPILDAAHGLLIRAVTGAGARLSDQDTLERALKDRQSDAVVVVGGTGSGRRDGAVQEVVRSGRLEAHGIAIGPGDTAAFGFVDERPVLLAPGRLDAALAVWLFIGRPLAAKLAGGDVDDRPAIVPLRHKVTSTIGVTELVPVDVREGMAEPLGAGYLTLTALAHSGGWIAVPADSEGFAAGAEVAVNPWP